MADPRRRGAVRGIVLQDTASELPYPILPVFLTAVLGAPVAVVGIAEGAADGAAALAKVAAGASPAAPGAVGYGWPRQARCSSPWRTGGRWYRRPGSSTGPAKACAARPGTRCSWTG